MEDLSEVGEGTTTMLMIGTWLALAAGMYLMRPNSLRGDAAGKPASGAGGGADQRPPEPPAPTA